MNRQLFIVICVSIVVCSGFEFTGNLSAKAIKDNKWNYQATTTSVVDIPLVYIGGNFIAGGSSGTLLGGNVDITVASAYIVTGGFPFAYLAYFKKNWNVTLSGQGFASADVSTSAGYMGNAFLRLEERDANNTLVATRSLKWILNLVTDQGFTYYLSEASKSSDDIQYVTFTGRSNDEGNINFAVGLTFLTARHAGIVGGEGIEDVPVVPGSLESIVTITNYPYKSVQNHISLVMVVATGSASVSQSGRTLFSGDKSVYFSVSKNAYVGTKKVSVDISTFAVGSYDDVDNSNLQVQLQGRYGGEASIKVVKVAFPPGANNIVYDPSIGGGVSVEDSGVASSSLFLSPLLSLVIFAIAFILV